MKATTSIAESAARPAIEATTSTAETAIANRSIVPALLNTGAGLAATHIPGATVIQVSQQELLDRLSFVNPSQYDNQGRRTVELAGQGAASGITSRPLTSNGARFVQAC